MIQYYIGGWRIIIIPNLFPIKKAFILELFGLRGIIFSQSLQLGSSSFFDSSNSDESLQDYSPLKNSCGANVKNFDKNLILNRKPKYAS